MFRIILLVWASLFPITPYAMEDSTRTDNLRRHDIAHQDRTQILSVAEDEISRARDSFYQQESDQEKRNDAELELASETLTFWQKKLQEREFQNPLTVASTTWDPSYNLVDIVGKGVSHQMLIVAQDDLSKARDRYYRREPDEKKRWKTELKLASETLTFWQEKLEKLKFPETKGGLSSVQSKLCDPSSSLGADLGTGAHISKKRGRSEIEADIDRTLRNDGFRPGISKKQKPNAPPPAPLKTLPKCPSHCDLLRYYNLVFDDFDTVDRLNKLCFFIPPRGNHGAKYDIAHFYHITSAIYHNTPLPRVSRQTLQQHRKRLVDFGVFTEERNLAYTKWSRKQNRLNK